MKLFVDRDIGTIEDNEGTSRIGIPLDLAGMSGWDMEELADLFTQFRLAARYKEG